MLLVMEKTGQSNRDKKRTFWKPTNGSAALLLANMTFSKILKPYFPIRKYFKTWKIPLL